MKSITKEKAMKIPHSTYLLSSRDREERPIYVLVKFIDGLMYRFSKGQWVAYVINTPYILYIWGNNIIE